MDTIGQFLEDCTTAVPTSQVRAKGLYASYAKWCEDSGEFCVSHRKFGQVLSERKGGQA